MRFEGSAGMSWAKSRTKSIVSQKRNADGTVFRKDEQLLLSERIPRERLAPGCFFTTDYYTAEGYTVVFFTRNKAHGIRVREGIPRVAVPSDAVITGMPKEMYGVSCWVIRMDKKHVPEGASVVEEYVVEQSTHVIRRMRYFDANGRQTMIVEYGNYDFSPEFPLDWFLLPKLDSLRFVEDWEECLEANAEVVKACVDEAGDSPATRRPQGSWLARHWRAICRQPGRAAFWGLVVASCLCLGTAGVLRRRRK